MSEILVTKGLKCQGFAKQYIYRCLTCFSALSKVVADHITRGKSFHPLGE